MEREKRPTKEVLATKIVKKGREILVYDQGKGRKVEMATRKH